MHPLPPRLKAATAFTLLELLVAIVIIAVLAVVAVTMSGSLWTTANQTRSSGNLRTMAQGLSAYVADYNGRLPESANYVSIPIAPGWAQMWYNGLAYYIEGPQYFPDGPGRVHVPKWLSCPQQKFPESEMGTYVNGSIRVGITVGYGWNFHYFGMAKNISPGQESLNMGYGSRMAQVESPAETIIIGTNREEILGERVRGDDKRNILLYKDSPTSRRFNGSGLYLFLDGHIEALTPEQAGRDKSYLFKRAKTATGF